MTCHFMCCQEISTNSFLIFMACFLSDKKKAEKEEEDEDEDEEKDESSKVIIFLN